MTDLPNELIPDSAVEAALRFLAESSLIGESKFNVVKAENLRKATWAKCFTNSDKKTVAEREADAECHPEYEAACSHEAKAIREHEEVKAKTLWATTITNLWQTVEANNRAAVRVR